MKVLVVNGPNLNLLGNREPEIYGRLTLAELDSQVRVWGADLGLEVETFQSNHEGAILDRIHAAPAAGCRGLVVNAGALAHSSIALHDAIRAVALPTVEVHLSNTASREEFRRLSYVTLAAFGLIAGLGPSGYRYALAALAERLGAGVLKPAGLGLLPKGKASPRDA